MKLLMLSNYFTPDLSAGSFRMQALIEAMERLNSQGDEGLEVTLITTRPNRYASLKTDAPAHEDRGWLQIHRIELPQHKGGMRDQATAYSRYAMGVRNLTQGKHWDVVFATSSRLMTAGLGARIAQKLRAPLYLDIRDLFTDNMDELLAGSPVKTLLPLFRQIERRAFRRASRINVVSQGFVSHIQKIAPGTPVSVFTNGIDDIFASADFGAPFFRGDIRPTPAEPLPIITYAGNMGEGQGLHRIIPEVADRLAEKVRFRMIGDGGRRKALEAEIAQRKLTNVELLPPVPRNELLEHYRAADILFLHLNDLDAFRKVLPSKVFEYGATRKPILAGVAGYAAEFCKEHLPDAEVFAPLDSGSMVQAIERLIAAPVRPDRTEFARRFARGSIMDSLACDIVQLADMK